MKTERRINVIAKRNDLSETVEATKDTIEKAGALISKAETSLASAKDAAVGKVASALDANGDGTLNIQDVIILAIKTPGVHVTREKFLRKEPFKNYPPEVVDDAIARTPALAGIPVEEISKIADEVINYERVCVSGISTALGMPGGAAMTATIPADFVQHYGYTLRAVQKLLYLYGFPEIDSDEEGVSLDSETVNRIIICLGVMNGVAEANNAIKGLAKTVKSAIPVAGGNHRWRTDVCIVQTQLYEIEKRPDRYAPVQSGAYFLRSRKRHLFAYCGRNSLRC